MKKALIISILCIISANLFSQTYKLETVFSSIFDYVYLSHWTPLENVQNNQIDTFSLWKIHDYIDGKAGGSYEVEYFKGSSKSMYQFLKHIVEFSEKYSNENNVLTYISNVQVKISKDYAIKCTNVYDKEHKTSCQFTQKRWTEILNKFVSYCDEKKIEYTEH